MIDTRLMDMVNKAESEIKDDFALVDQIAFLNTEKVLKAFQDNAVALRHFAGTNGYGYDDIGKEKLAKLYADIFHTESALVSPLMASGTHALTIMLFAVLRPGDTLLAISGKPYDTLQEVIGGDNIGSLKDFGVKYDEVGLVNGKFDFDTIREKIESNSTINSVFIGRSRGYEWRNALSVDEIGEAVRFVKSIRKDIVVMVDNCYGEFVELYEPTDVGADIMAGSLNKNPGGGIVNSGGYIVGTEKLVEQAGYRLIAPSVGNEVGSYAPGYQTFYEGLFMAPTVVANAIKGSILFGQVYHNLGYETMPAPHEVNHDIIRSIKFDTSDELIEFIKAIQFASPIDSNVEPCPWPMPGYDDDVIMAAGTFVQGASIELSADSPIRAPYVAYLQGGLTYEHVKLAVLSTLKYLKK